MDDFFDSPLSIDIDIRDTRKRIDPVQYDCDGEPFVYIVLEKPLDNRVLTSFITAVKREITTYENKTTAIKIISVLPFHPSEKDLSKGIIDFYVSNMVDLKKYIKPYSKVICTGRSIYSIIGSDDLLIEGFYDFVFNKTYFYDPELKSYIFPVDDVDEWLHIEKGKVRIKDNWERFFTLKQIKTIYKESFQFNRTLTPKIVVVNDPNAFLLEHTNKAVWTALDIETKHLDPWDSLGKILCISIAFDGRTGYFLDWDKIDPTILSNFLRNKKLIFHNGKYDAKWLVMRGVERASIHICHDTWPGSHLLNEMQAGRLKSGAFIYTSFGGYDNELELYKKKYPACKHDYSLIPRDLMIKYAAMDAIVTFLLFEAQVKEIDRLDREFPNPNANWPIKRYFYEIMVPAMETFLDIEIEGMPINIERLQEVSDELQTEIDKLLVEIYFTFKMTPDDINLDSDEQMGMLLEARGLPNHGRGKKKIKHAIMASFVSKLNSRVKIDSTKGIFLTGEDQLLKWKNKDGFKEIELIIKYRELTTLMKSFVGKREDNSGMWQYIKADGKIHANFGPMLTLSHRNWCKEPNLQNQPKHGKWAERIRSFFASPGPDFDIGEQDGSGLQLRIGAVLSGDEEMKKIFLTHGDMHSVTAVSVLKRGMTFEEFTNALHDDTNKSLQKDLKLIRYKSKTVNFQLEFGATAYNFALTIIDKEWTKEEVDQYIKNNDLEDKPMKFYERASAEGKLQVDLDFCKCWAVAKDIRDKFFDKYRGLHNWIETTGEFVKDHGYIRSPFGAIRRLPQLIHIGADDPRQRVKNLLNISVNSPVQNYEVFLMMKTMNGLAKHIRNTPEMKTRLAGNVHDSIVSFPYRSEEKELIALSKSFFEEDIPENKGIPMIIEAEFADYWNKGQAWGFGKEMK